MTQSLNSEYWESRYVAADFGWDVGSITDPLKNYFDQIKDKNISILIPGAGNSYEAEYLVNNKFTNVYICDFAHTPLKSLKDRCSLVNENNLICCDFFELNSSHTSVLPLGFDLIIEQTFFCALKPALRKKYFEKMSALLKPGGKLVGLLFNDPLSNDGPPFGGTKEEYYEYFSAYFKEKTYELSYNSIKPREGRELFINLIRK